MKKKSRKYKDYSDLQKKSYRRKRNSFLRNTKKNLFSAPLSLFSLV